MLLKILRLKVFALSEKSIKNWCENVVHIKYPINLPSKRKVASIRNIHQESLLDVKVLSMSEISLKCISVMEVLCKPESHNPTFHIYITYIPNPNPNPAKEFVYVLFLVFQIHSEHSWPWRTFQYHISISNMKYFCQLWVRIKK